MGKPAPDRSPGGAATVTIDACGRITSASDKWLEITGLTSEEALLGSLASLSHADDEAAILAALAWASETSSPIDVRYRLRVGGGFRWVRMRGEPDRAPSGPVDAWRCVVEDVHAEALAAQALVESEARLRAVLENIGDAVIAFGREPGHGFANRAFLDLFGGDVAFGTIETAMNAVAILDADGEPVPRDERPMLRVLTGERIRDLETRLRLADGREIDVVYNGQPVLGPDGEVELAVLTIRDVTAAKAAAAELRALNMRLIHVSRVGAMGSLASAISHEIAQPLTAIANALAAGRLLLARHGAEAVPAALDALANAERAAKLARGILDRLRGMIRRRDATTRREAVCSLIDDALLFAAPARADRARVSVDCPEAPVFVLADRVQIQQVLINLVRNAVEAAGHGRRSVRVEVRDEDEVTISVADRGPGIAPEIRANLFAPFNTSKAGGTGIGLSICRAIIEGHGGRIWAEDRAGGGAVFRFTLPRA